MKPKCKREGCYNPADCKHGYCAPHCIEEHDLADYSQRTYPKTNSHYIGIELEVNFNGPQDFRRGVAALGGHHDSSLGPYSAEYKMCRPASSICKYACRLTEELWKLKARASTKCGFHVHLDARNITTSRFREFFHWAFFTQDYWFSLMPKSRRRSDYAVKIVEAEIISMVSSPGSHHHYWISRTPYPTIEVRLHSGTTNPYKVEGWLTALIHLQSKIYNSTFSFERIESDKKPLEQAKETFWKVFEDCPKVGKEYLLTRERNGGVIRDYAFNPQEEQETEAEEENRPSVLRRTRTSMISDSQPEF